MADQATKVYARYPSLEDRAVYITGGSSGIGASLVRLFSDQGAQVAFCDIDADAAEKVLAECAEAKHVPRFTALDLRDTTALKDDINSAATQFGGLKVLVNNAAHDDRHHWAEVTQDYWDDRFAVNLRHQFFAIQASAPHMKSSGGGAIINMGSASWLLKEEFFPGYATAKSAVQGLTTTMARALGVDDITVNTVLPGWVLTDRQLEKWWSPEGEAKSMELQCIKRRLMPDEYNQLILWLAADDGGACTAQSFIVDMGRAGI
jgi:NAD(P)-dependent dehydrogenase (short-subunit alcohol dehydrogenase family)